MFSKINSICLRGMEGRPVSVEADVSDGLPGYALVGYLSSEVREAQDRVRTAIRNLGLKLPPKKITINLSPADFKKEGTGFDLAIAAAVLAAYGIFSADQVRNVVFAGELGLNGKVKGIPGILAMADSAKKLGFSWFCLSEDNRREAEAIEGLRLIVVKDLRTLVDIMTGKRQATPDGEKSREMFFDDKNQYTVDFSEVNGQLLLRRAAEVAAAGMHNLLMIGPAGSGKTMIARRMPTIMPELDKEESIAISKIYSISHLLSNQEPLILRRPFRSPHHTVSMHALAGGGVRPKPGEVSLATGGILFLDEIAEMRREALEVLREPLEERQITISRVQESVRYPANFQLVAAMNPCPCGNPEECTCTRVQIRRYLGKLSKPLLDRIDICVESAPLTYTELTESGENESSEMIRGRVKRAREIQTKRFEGTGISCNGEMSGSQVRQFCTLDQHENQFMRTIFKEMEFSARMYDKILKVARTAADLDECETIGHRHLCEAASYVRVKARYWNY